MSFVHTYANKKKLEQSKRRSSQPALTTQYSITNHDSPAARYFPGLYSSDQRRRTGLTTKASAVYLLPYIDFVLYRPGKKPQIKESKDRTATEQDCIGAKISPRIQLGPVLCPYTKSYPHQSNSLSVCLFVCLSVD